MALSPYPVPVTLRETVPLVGDGGTHYGPFNFKIFDIDDAKVYLKRATDPEYALATVTVTKVGDLPFADFTIDFGSAVTSADRFIVRSERWARRSAGVTKGTKLSLDAIELELSRAATQDQEIKRELQRSLRMAPGAGDGYTVSEQLEPGDTLMLGADGNIGKGPDAIDILNAQANSEAAAEAYAAILEIIGQINAAGAHTIPLSAGQTTVTVPGGFSTLGLLVFYNGVLLDGYSALPEYTASTPVITLAAPATAGSVLNVFDIKGRTVINALEKAQNLQDLPDAKVARQNIGISVLSSLADANLTLLPGVRQVVTSQALTAPRTITLPSAASVLAGEAIEISDVFGALTLSNYLTIAAAAGQTINGSSSSTFATTYGQIRLISDGSSKWALSKLSAAASIDGILVGTIIDYPGPRLPSKYLYTDGQAVARSTYAALLAALTLVTSGNLTSGSATVAGVPENLTNFGLVGAKVEGTGIPSGTTISAITSNSITLSANAVTTGAAVMMTVFPHGNGDGATTFNVPDIRARTVIGRDGALGTKSLRVNATGGGNPGIDASKLGAAGGVDRHTLTGTELPTNTLINSGTSQSWVGAGSAPLTYGGGGAHENVQPTVVLNKIIFSGV